MDRFPCRFLMSHVATTAGPTAAVVEASAFATTSLARRRRLVRASGWQSAQTTLRRALGILALSTVVLPLAAAPLDRLWYEAWEVRAAGVTAAQVPVVSEILPADPDVPLPHQVGVLRRDGAGRDRGLFVYDARSTRYHLVAILHDDGVDAAPLVTALLTAIRDGGRPAAIHTYATSETVLRTSVPATPTTVAPGNTPSPNPACGCPPERAAPAAPAIATVSSTTPDARPRLAVATSEDLHRPSAQPWAPTGGALTAGALVAVAVLAALVAVVRIVLLHREQMALLRTSLTASHPPPSPTP